MPTVRREHPPVTLTCSHLYETDSTFRSAIEKWVADRRCPIQLGDYLEEYGLSDAADCARWCYDQPDREVWKPHLRGGEVGSDCGPFPTMNNEDDKDEIDYGWFWSLGVLICPHRVPLDSLPTTVEGVYHPTPHAAIVFLLDSWRRTE